MVSELKQNPPRHTFLPPHRVSRGQELLGTAMGVSRENWGSRQVWVVRTIVFEFFFSLRRICLLASIIAGKPSNEDQIWLIKTVEYT